MSSHYEWIHLKLTLIRLSDPDYYRENQLTAILNPRRHMVILDPRQHCDSWRRFFFVHALFRGALMTIDGNFMGFSMWMWCFHGTFMEIYMPLHGAFIAWVFMTIWCWCFHGYLLGAPIHGVFVEVLSNTCHGRASMHAWVSMVLPCFLRVFTVFHGVFFRSLCPMGFHGASWSVLMEVWMLFRGACFMDFGGALMRLPLSFHGDEGGGEWWCTSFHAGFSWCFRGFPWRFHDWWWFLRGAFFVEVYAHSSFRCFHHGAFMMIWTIWFQDVFMALSWCSFVMILRNFHGGRACSLIMFFSWDAADILWAPIARFPVVGVARAITRWWCSLASPWHLHSWVFRVLSWGVRGALVCFHWLSCYFHGAFMEDVGGFHQCFHVGFYGAFTGFHIVL